MDDDDEQKAPVLRAYPTPGYRIPRERALPGTGDYTGRCWRCGSNNLWDDNLSYGCNDCGMIRIGS